MKAEVNAVRRGFHPSSFRLPPSSFNHVRLSLVNELDDGDESVGVGRVVDADDRGRGVFAFDLDAALQTRGLYGLLQLRELRVLCLDDATARRVRLYALPERGARPPLAVVALLAANYGERVSGRHAFERAARDDDVEMLDRGRLVELEGVVHVRRVGFADVRVRGVRTIFERDVREEH